MANDGSLRALVVDDELPALSEVRFLLSQDQRVGEVLTATSGTEALRMLEAHDVDVIFSDISMPGLDGMALGRVLARFAAPPQLVFVTAHEQHAVDAFALAATALILLPGPAMLFLISRGIGQGSRRLAISSMAGIEAATAVMVVATAFGLSAVISSSVIAFSRSFITSRVSVR